MKGIVLAGGHGTRLYPATQVMSKQLMPVYDKPMVYYSICTLMMAGIREILIISTPSDLPLFKKLLGDGSQWGIALEYCEQANPEGLAQAFILAEDFIDGDAVSLILGDNIFYGEGLSHTLKDVANNLEGAAIFGYYVNDPERYGVVEYNDAGEVIDIVEKPSNPKSNYAITGLYFYSAGVVEAAKSLTPSARGELEITDLNKIYLQRKELTVKIFGRGTSWLDMGTHESRLEAASFIHIVEKRQGLKIGSPEEVSWRSGYIDDHQLEKLANQYKNDYGDYLRKILKQGK